MNNREKVYPYLYQALFFFYLLYCLPTYCLVIQLICVESFPLKNWELTYLVSIFSVSMKHGKVISRVEEKITGQETELQ